MRCGRLLLLVVFVALCSTNCTARSYKRKSERSLRDMETRGDKPCTCSEKKHRRLKRQITDIKLTQCSNMDTADEELIRISNLTFSQVPLIAPGKSDISFNFDVLKKLPSNIQIDVNMYKYLFNLPLWLPCTTLSDNHRIGSCTYNDVCTTISDEACSILQSNSLPCSCKEFPVGQWVMKNYRIVFPDISDIFDVLVQGEYKMRSEFVNRDTQKVIGCFGATWKISKIHRNSKLDTAKLFYRSSHRRRRRL